MRRGALLLPKKFFAGCNFLASQVSNFIGVIKILEFFQQE
jgi:hypothetical protein